MEKSTTSAIPTVRLALLGFAGLVVAVYAAAIALAARLPVLERADLVALGMTLDMVLIVPTAFYFLVVRPRCWTPALVIPVLLLSFLAASRIVPPGNRQALGVLEWLVIPLEIGLIGAIIWRTTRALRRSGNLEAADPLQRFRQAGLDLLGRDRLAALFASEIAIFYYGFGAWRATPQIARDTEPFTHHERSGHAGILIGFLLLLLVEGFAVHMLLFHWSRPLAWTFTFSTIYAALWLLADYRATVLRPILVGADSVHLRAGLRWNLEVPGDRITGISREKPDLGREAISLVFVSKPTHWILFEPLEAEGPYGIRRMVRAAGVEMDEPEAFLRALKTLTPVPPNPGSDSI